MRVYLKVLQGKSAGKTVKIPDEKFLIGRAENCHLRPKSDAISRRHCVVLISDSTVRVRDLNSRNGTHINEQKIDEETEISSGDVIRIGRLEFELIIKDRVAKQVANGGGSAIREEGGSSIVEDVDISDWLDESPDAANKSRAIDPDTRQYRLDETERVTLDKARAETEAAEQEGKQKESKEKESKEKKEPGKLPPSAAQSADSRDAAEQMLKRFFNRR